MRRMHAFSRRTLLKGIAAGAGLAVAAPALRRASRSAAAPGLRAPGSLPFPNLPEGTDTLPQIEHIVVLMMENHSFDDHFGMLKRGDGFKLGSDGKPVDANPNPDGSFLKAFHI